MKIKYYVFLILCLFLLVGCSFFGQKEKFSEYLNREQYQFKNNCFQKIKENEQEGILQKYCLNDCMYYAMDSNLDDYFSLNMNTQDVFYIYDSVTYKYSIKRSRAICSFQGEEIDLESSYCKNANIMVQQHLDLFQEELDGADVNIRFICR